MGLKGIKKGVFFQWTLRILLTAACIGMLAFIFSNSLKTGEQSVQQSSAMVEVVQEVAAVIAPNSSIANATGESYDRLHSWVRAWAHFSEFALFGALLMWCIVSYMWQEKGMWLSLVGVCVVPLIDESLQYFVVDRGVQFYDVCADVAGGICGILFAIVALLIILSVRGRWQRKKLRRAERVQTPPIHIATN